MTGRVKISIAGLMVVVLILALAIAALRACTPLAASLVYTGVLLLLLTGVVGAAANLNRRQFGWFGLTLFGTSYLALAFGPWAWVNNEGLRPPALATLPLVRVIPWWLLPAAYGSNRVVAISAPVATLSSPGALTITPPPGGLMLQVKEAPGEQVVHSLMAFVFAAVGYAVGSHFSNKTVPSEP